METEEVKAETWQPRGGRPKATDADRRDKVYPIRLTETERGNLDKLASAAGYTDLSVYVRKKLFSEEGASVHNPKELFHAIDRTGAALKKIGTNLNQVAKYVHHLEKNNMVSQPIVLEYNQLIRQLIEAETDYIKAIRAYLRTAR